MNRRVVTAIACLVVVAAFAAAVAWQIRWPGLYMDAVNPDYLAIDVLHGPQDARPMWYLPGNLIAKRVPLLTSFYHGTLQTWLALPFVAAFGASTPVLRIAQATAGVTILLLMLLWLRRRNEQSDWWVALPVFALALDPVFVFAFRTQVYIQLSPVALLLGSILCGLRALDTQVERSLASRRRWLIGAGICFGLSVFGYFIFAFFAPVLGGALLLAWRERENRPPLWQTLLCVGVGSALGAIGYVYGYFRIARAEGGLHGFLEYFAAYQHDLGAFQHHRGLVETLQYFGSLVGMMFDNAWQHSLMFGEPSPQPGAGLKLALLLAFPSVLWLLAELRGRSSGDLRLVVALLISYPLVGLVFGDRLSGHHFVVLLPLSYLALGFGLIALSPKRSSMRLGATAAACVALIGCNLTGLAATSEMLEKTHGRGLFSDAIDRFASDSLNAEIPGHSRLYFLPDWGLFMPFHFLTDGRVRHWTDIDPAVLRRELCHGQSISVALVGADAVPRLERLATQIGWGKPALRPYSDHEGTAVFEVGDFDAADSTASPERCQEP